MLRLTFPSFRRLVPRTIKHASCLGPRSTLDTNRPPSPRSAAVNEFSTTTHLLKKKDKSKRSSLPDDATPTPQKNVSTDLDVEELLSKLNTDIASSLEKMRSDLMSLRTRRTDPKVLESLTVHLKSAGTTARLSDLAHVVPKGTRALTVTVYEAADVKRVVSAIQTADLGMQPVVDEKNPSVVNVPLPVMTQEAREQIAEGCKKVGDKALDGVRAKRGIVHKKLQDWKKQGGRPDDVRKAEKRLEEAAKKGKEEVEELVKGSRKSVLGG